MFFFKENKKKLQNATCKGAICKNWLSINFTL